MWFPPNRERSILADATTKFTLALASDKGKTQLLELSEGFEFGRADLMDGVKAYLAEAAKRLKNPRPDCYVTLHGLPLSFGRFGWPFHESTSGADTSLVHGEVRLEDGGESVLHAKIAASMTVTFRDIVRRRSSPSRRALSTTPSEKPWTRGSWNW